MVTFGLYLNVLHNMSIKMAKQIRGNYFLNARRINMHSLADRSNSACVLSFNWLQLLSIQTEVPPTLSVIFLLVFHSVTKAE